MFKAKLKSMKKSINDKAISLSSALRERDKLMLNYKIANFLLSKHGIKLRIDAIEFLPNDSSTMGYLKGKKNEYLIEYMIL